AALGVTRLGPRRAPFGQGVGPGGHGLGPQGRHPEPAGGGAPRGGRLPGDHAPHVALEVDLVDHPGGGDVGGVGADEGLDLAPSQRRVPPGSQTWSISVRTSVWGSSGENVTGPGTVATGCQTVPPQSVPDSTVNWLAPVLRARRTVKVPGLPLMWRWPCSWTTTRSTPSNLLSWTVMSPAGAVPILV